MLLCEPEKCRIVQSGSLVQLLLHLCFLLFLCVVVCFCWLLCVCVSLSVGFVCLLLLVVFCNIELT